MSHPPELLTPAEVAEIFRVTKMTVSRWSRDGTLPAVRIGGTLRFRSEDIDALLAEREESSS